MLELNIELTWIVRAESYRHARLRLTVLSVTLTAFAFTSCRSAEIARNSPYAPQSENRSGATYTAQADSERTCLNLNTATAKELMALPTIGEVMANKVIEYRERHGPFRRPQEIIIIEGFSEKKYRVIAGMICVK